MGPVQTSSPLIGSPLPPLMDSPPLFSISELGSSPLSHMTAVNTSPPFSPTITSSEVPLLALSAAMNSDDAVSTLFQVIQEREISPTEKNIRFARLLGKIQLAAALQLQLHTYLTMNQLTFRLCSSNTFVPRESEDVENASVPFCILNPRHNESSLYEVAQIDFNSIVLPTALRNQINQNTTYIQKAGVASIQTLQEWAHGYTYSLELPLSEAMPNVTSFSYKIAALVPVKRDDQHSVTHWNPYVRGETGPKMLFSYSASDQDETAHGRATHRMSRRNNYIPMQDVTETNSHWIADSFTFGKEKLKEAIAKIKAATMNFAVLPVHPIEPYPRTVSSPQRFARNSSAIQSSFTYGTYNATGRHKVEAHNAVHMQITPIPIDVTQITSREQLVAYLQDLTTLVKTLEQPDDQPTENNLENLSSVVPLNPMSPKTISPSRNFMQIFNEGFAEFRGWITRVVHSLFSNLNNA